MIRVFDKERLGGISGLLVILSRIASTQAPVFMLPISVARYARPTALCREGWDSLQSALVTHLRDVPAVQGNGLLLHAMST